MSFIALSFVTSLITSHVRAAMWSVLVVNGAVETGPRGRLQHTLKHNTGWTGTVDLTPGFQSQYWKWLEQTCRGVFMHKVSNSHTNHWALWLYCFLCGWTVSEWFLQRTIFNNQSQSRRLWWSDTGLFTVSVSLRFLFESVFYSVSLLTLYSCFCIEM